MVVCVKIHFAFKKMYVVQKSDSVPMCCKVNTDAKLLLSGIYFPSLKIPNTAHSFFIDIHKNRISCS